MASALAKLVRSSILETEKTGGMSGITPIIDQVLSLTDMSEDRRDGMFHPSDLSKDFCPRAWSLYNHHPKGYEIKEGAVEPRLQRIFGNGHGVHHRLQDIIGKKTGVLFGTWKRVIGYNTDADETPHYEVRDNCFKPGPSWTYGEVKLVHGEDNILGSTDGILNLEGRKDGLELKSIRSDGFKWLNDAPQEAHIYQTYIYLYCLEWMREKLANSKVLNSATHTTAHDKKFLLRPLDGFWVVYENKDSQELKQFYVKNDAEKVNDFIDSLRKRMHRAKMFEREGEHPPCQCPPKKPSALCKAFPYLAAA